MNKDIASTAPTMNPTRWAEARQILQASDTDPAKCEGFNAPLGDQWGDKK
jgi:hypothetical protein